MGDVSYAVIRLANPVLATYGANEALATLMPADDSIPQVTEGDEILSASFTALNAAHRVRVTFQGVICSSTSADNVIAALFIDGAANAARAVNLITADDDFPAMIALQYEAVLPAGPHTFSIRVGGSNFGVYMNGTSGGRRMGGASAATLTVEELNAP